MKFEIFIIIISLLVLVSNSCEKDSSNDNGDDITKDITGQWEWLFTYKALPLSETNPLTPENTGIHENIIFKTNFTWRIIENGIKSDSGTYSLGHGSHCSYPDAHIFIYDSILYYSSISNSYTWDYYDVFNDTLQFCPGFAGKLASYNSFNFPNGFNGSKFWKKK